MEINETPLRDCYIINNTRFADERGFFMESFNKKAFKDFGIDFDPCQLNYAGSSKNVLRGLHYQLEPHSQSKLVGIINGAVLDIVVDLRKNSSTFKQSFKIILENQNTMLYIPKGFAHGYYTLKDDTIFYYLVDHLYTPEVERGILYCDKQLNIDWELTDNPIISQKDLNQPSFTKAEINF